VITRWSCLAANAAGAASTGVVISPSSQILWSIHIFVDMCRDIVNILVEGHGHRSDETTRMRMLTSSSLAARIQGQQARKQLYLIRIRFSGHEILQRCVRLYDSHVVQRNLQKELQIVENMQTNQRYTGWPQGTHQSVCDETFAGD